MIIRAACLCGAKRGGTGDPGILASAMLAGLALNAGAGLRADPLTALVIVFYAQREARALPAQAGGRVTQPKGTGEARQGRIATPSKVYPSARGPFM
jgi:hypothetical protein